MMDTNTQLRQLDCYVVREYIKAGDDFGKLWAATGDGYGFKEHDRLVALEARMKAFDDMLQEIHRLVDAG